METFRLWLEDDKEIPRFKRLKYAKVTVSLADVLKKGIHPWMGPTVHHTLKERFIQILNEEEYKPGELAQFSYCSDIAKPFYSRSNGYRSLSSFEDVLQLVCERIYFIKALSYTELLDLAKERLQNNWCHKVASDLLDRAFPGFDSRRTFLKTKDKNIKVSGYADFDNYDFGRILSLEDFASEDNILIQQGIPLHDFRSVKFLDQVTDERGLLRIKDEIRDFQITTYGDRPFCEESVLYNCRRDGQAIRFRPIMDKNPAIRTLAKRFASLWRIDDGRYCFTTDIARVSRMIQESTVKISFTSLNYLKPEEGGTSSASITKSKVDRYSLGGFVNCEAACGELRDLLRQHNVSMSGRKGKLLEKLAELSVKIYKERVKELDAYFSEHRFVKVPNDSKKGKDFPLLNGIELRNMVLRMYAIKHLRGNAILEAQHENDTFDLLSLAKSLINREDLFDAMLMKVG